ncbi:MAG: hypothetical protein E6I97_02480 [Chloroflexi bacterium]|nr:MAG: hypothetical protein E6I97_02480 [Chloroflexota bacterium]
MVRAIAQTKGKRASHKSASMRPDITEHRIRQVSAWIVLCLLLLAEFGLAWDRRWHDMVGRDQFWIPPHIMMYTGIAGAGLIALCVVLVDTLRYYQKKAGVDDSSTVNILWFFHAPLGFILLGIGMLIDAIAAPLDNYWHVLYGVDVTFWAPFHLMGHLGAVIGVLGIIYAFASEAAYERQVEHPSPRLLGLNGPEWGIVVLLAGFQEVVLPALTAFIPIVLGPVQLITYPLILVLAASLFPISLYLCIRKPGITLLMILILWPLSLATETFTPLALRFMVARLGLTYRLGREPVFDVTIAMLPLLYLVCALMVEAAVSWQRRSGEARNDELRGTWLLGVLMAVPAVVIPPGIAHAFSLWAPAIPLPPDVVHVLEPGWLAMLLTLPIAMLVGAIMASLGTVFGDIWHWNRQ